MKKTLMVLLASGFLLTACGDKATKEGSGDSAAAANTPPEKRQPGSWSQKIEIVKLEGDDVKPGDRAQMDQMFAMLSGMSVCLTPEAAAREDMAKNLSDMGSRGENCTFDKRVASGSNVEFSATCKGDGGNTMRMSAKGTSGATSQDITMSMTANKVDGSKEGEMVMRVTSERKGECGPNDITPPSNSPATKS